MNEQGRDWGSRGGVEWREGVSRQGKGWGHKGVVEREEMKTIRVESKINGVQTESLVTELRS